MILAPSGMFSQQVTGLFVYHTSGQTFLKWKSSGAGTTSYTVYRSRKPLRTALALARAEQVYHVKPGQTHDRRLSAIIDSPVFFRFPGPSGRLGSDEECFVVTTTHGAAWYYAVTSTTRKGESRQIRPGRNATASGVRERMDRPRPVFQNRLTWEGRAVDVFVHWISNVDIADYPAMTNVSCFPVHIGLRKNGKALLHPLHVRLHGRGDNFLENMKGSGNPQEYIISLDDNLPAYPYNTFWFGFTMGGDISSRMVSPPGSVVVDYTLRRVLWTIRWAVRELPVDSTRVYLSGASMGGTGAFLTALAAPREIAGALSTTPRLRFASRDSTDTPRGASALNAFDALWGRPDHNPQMMGGERVYDFLDGVRRLRTSDLNAIPPIRIIAGTRDSVVGWRQLVDVLRSSDTAGSGITAFWDERDHDTQGPNPWSPQQDIAHLFRYRSNRSWPAFSSVAVNDLPGEGSARGMINAAVDWFEPVIDSPTLWSAGIRRAVIESRDTVFVVQGPLTATITPRRIQRFRILSGGWYTCEVRDGLRKLYSKAVQASRDGTISFPALPVPSQPVRVEIRPLVGPVPQK